jgi:hypothetical protein
MRTRFRLLAIVLFISAFAVAPIVGADGTGSGISNATGYYLLRPAGTINYTLHAYLADLGLPVSRGDTLIYSWRANNGSGPPIYFEIHAHPITGGYFAFYNTTADSVTNRTWTAPRTDRFMVLWQNPSNRTTVNLTYSFVLILAPSDYWPLYIAPLLIAAIAAVSVAAHVLARRKQPPE